MVAYVVTKAFLLADISDGELSQACPSMSRVAQVLGKITSVEVDQ